MRSCSESGYAVKVANLEKLLTLLKNIESYLPHDLTSIVAELRVTTFAVKEQNDAILLKKQYYSDAVENLRQLFIKSDDSIRKRLSLIGITIKTSFGKTSKEAADVMVIISKIRGANRVHNVGNSSIDNNINQSYISYTSQSQLFAELILYLENLGKAYSPSCNDLRVPDLKNLLEEAINANDAVIVAYTGFLQLKNARSEACVRLSGLVQQIKTAVKKQDYILPPAEIRHIKCFKL